MAEPCRKRPLYHAQILGAKLLDLACRSPYDYLHLPFRHCRSIAHCRDLIGRLASIGSSERDAAMVEMLHQLPQLQAMDAEMRGFLAGAEFVPTESGRLRAPDQLFDPRCEKT